MAIVAPFDAVLVIAFGGPKGPADVRPFLGNVLRGRRVSPERMEEVAHHYAHFGGVSPITELTMRQADALRARLQERELPLPVYVGMRNWHPFLAETLAVMSREGVRRAIGLIAAAHRSYSSCAQYRENVDAARVDLRRDGLDDVQVCYVTDWHAHAGFVAANAERIIDALRQLPSGLQTRARVVFTAHSIPATMADKYPYREQIEETARLVMQHVHRRIPPSVERRDPSPEPPAPSPDSKSAVVYQSRSGRPEDPWLGPDICEYLRAQKATGLEAVVIAPIGFVCDHVEVLYDLDVEASAVCRELDLPMVRAQSVNDHPMFIDAIADSVIGTYRRYEHARPLPLVASR